MPIAITDDHLEITEAVRAALTGHDARSLARRVLDDPTTDTGPLWRGLADLGWLGLAIPETYGGAGAGLVEACLVAEELGRHLAPVPYLATVALSAAIVSRGTEELKEAWLPRLADGSVRVGLGLDDIDEVTAGESVVASGSGADLLALTRGADVLLLPADDSPDHTPASGIDPGAGVTRVRVHGADPVGRIPGAADELRRVARILGAAEAAGGASAAVEAALGYAKVREQFGRPIGSFQAIKHQLADMFAAAELAVAAAWDAARTDAADHQGDLAAATAAVVAFDSYVTTAERSIQIHGGIGFTWEHDCHLHLRRAHALRTVAARTTEALDILSSLSRDGARRRHSVALPPEAERFRADARVFVDRYHAAPEARRRELLVDTGYLVPHWPAPFGRAASPVEQLVIEEELAGIDVPNLGIGGWILLTLAQHGSPEQIERWLRPGLVGDLTWCQLFSEPGAGSDAAAVSTRATRVEGGWRITGQKVWTSNAHLCNRGLATVRTNPDLPKHKGITTVVVDLDAEGVTIRPLREITGDAVFNEVFFDDVFIPDQDVVGAVDDGWTVARATLGNERVSIGGGVGEYSAVTLFDLTDRSGAQRCAVDPESARLLAHEQAIGALNARHVVRAVEGSGPGPEGNLTKLLGSELSQRVGELAMRVAGRAVLTGEEDRVSFNYLFARAMTIAGGTSEINRNVIAERMLELPREQIAN